MNISRGIAEPAPVQAVNYKNVKTVSLIGREMYHFSSVIELTSTTRFPADICVGSTIGFHWPALLFHRPPNASTAQRMSGSPSMVGLKIPAKGVGGTVATGPRERLESVCTIHEVIAPWMSRKYKIGV